MELIDIDIEFIEIIKIDSLQTTINYYEKITKHTDNNTKIILDFSNTEYIRNNYISIIGMAIEILKSQDISVDVIPPNDNKVYKLLNDTGFIYKYAENHRNTKIDTKNMNMITYTHIPLKNFDEEISDFYFYFFKKLSERMENLSPNLLKKIIQKIFELFSNVFRHSYSELGLFCSGQFYPDTNKFYFTIVDNGTTIRKNVNKFLKKEFKKNKNFTDLVLNRKFKPFNGIDSIIWAIKDKNSTTGAGGLGLSLLEDLITQSNGRLEIISNNGYYKLEQKEVVKKTIETFEGTIISIGLDTCKDKYFYLNGDKDAN